MLSTLRQCSSGSVDATADPSSCGGILPALIEWPPGLNPVAALPDSGLALACLKATHPDPAMVMDCLDRLELSYLMEISEGAPSLGFVFDSAGGELLFA